MATSIHVLCPEGTFAGVQLQTGLPQLLEKPQEVSEATNLPVAVHEGVVDVSYCKNSLHAY